MSVDVVPEPPMVQEPHSLPEKFLSAIPRVSASKPHIWLLVAMWFYLVPMAILWPALVPVSIAVAMGNHTNVVSAVGASIAAGASVGAYRHAKARHEETAKHTQLLTSIHEHLTGQRET